MIFPIQRLLRRRLRCQIGRHIRGIGGLRLRGVRFGGRYLRLRRRAFVAAGNQRFERRDLGLERLGLGRRLGQIIRRYTLGHGLLHRLRGRLRDMIGEDLGRGFGALVDSLFEGRFLDRFRGRRVGLCPAAFVHAQRRGQHQGFRFLGGPGLWRHGLLGLRPPCLHFLTCLFGHQPANR